MSRDFSSSPRSGPSSQLNAPSSPRSQFSQGSQTSRVPRTPSSAIRHIRSDLGSQYRPISSQGSLPRTPSSGSGGAFGSSSRALGSQTSDHRSDDGLELEPADHNQTVWGTTIDMNRAIDEITTFIKTFPDPASESKQPLYPRLLDEIVMTGLKHMNINCANLASAAPEQYLDLIHFPMEMIPIFDWVVNRILNEEHSGVAGLLGGANLQPIQVRPFGLLETKNMRELNPDDIDTLVSVKGMVIRCGNVIPELSSAYFECQRCNYAHIGEIDMGQITEPISCSNCNAKHQMQLIHNRGTYTDKQLLKIQETPDAIPDGETPHTVTVFAYGSLVDVVKPGDRVEITGIYRARPVRVNPGRRTVRTVFRTYLDAIHFKRTDARKLNEDDSVVDGVRVVEGEYIEGDDTTNRRTADERKLQELGRDRSIYERLVQSLAPSIHEMDDVKRGILCMLFGGTNNDGAGSGKFRGEINVLLCGDPGTSKSQLLQYVHKIAPRGIYTSGKGSSAVGLTAYVAKDPVTRELVLESGALVLSDKGVCCIDEFDKMNDSTRSILHEVMEQQTVSIAKAGIVCTLNARTSILASANPKQSRYNPKLSVVRNIELGPTLLSRFDLIYLILDQPNPTSDRRLARHLVGMYFETPETRANDPRVIPTELLAQYIAYARKTVHPVCDSDADAALVEAYTKLRRQGHGESKKVVTATPRQLESLIRLSEALARMKLKSVVTREEVDEAARLMNVATQSAATDPTTGRIDMDLLTTGQSAFERRRAEIVREAMHAMLSNKIAQGKRNSILKVDTVVAEFNSGSGLQPMNAQEVRTVLGELAAEGFIEITKARGGVTETIRLIGDQV